MAWVDVTSDTYFEGAYVYGNSLTVSTGNYTYTGGAWVPANGAFSFLVYGLTLTTAGITAATLAGVTDVRITCIPASTNCDDGSSYKSGIGFSESGDWADDRVGQCFINGTPIALVGPIQTFADVGHGGAAAYFLSAGIVGSEFWSITKIEFGVPDSTGPVWQDFVNCAEVDS